MAKFITKKLDGNDSMGARELFIKRILYNGLAFDENAGLGPNMVKDFHFGQRIFYGRVDDKYHLPIKLDVDFREKDLKVVFSKKGKHLLLVNFVADAFNDMKKRIRRDLNAGKIPNDDPFFSNLSPKRAYMSLDGMHKEHNKRIYEAFESYVKKYDIDRDIVNFESYVPHFMQFIQLLTHLDFPFTQVGFSKSKFSSPLISGLVVDLSEDNTSDDSLKTKVLYHENFKYYLQIAGLYGFSVDKHIPTRLVADLNSPFMKKYMEKYYVSNSRQVIFKYFTGTQADSYKIMKRDMVSFYNKYVSEQPNISGHKVCDSGNILATSTRRMPIIHENVFSDLGDGFFIEKYIDIRHLEERTRMGEAKKEYLKKRAKDIFKSLDLEDALKYIEYEFTSNDDESNSISKIRERLEIKG